MEYGSDPVLGPGCFVALCGFFAAVKTPAAGRLAGRARRLRLCGMERDRIERIKSLKQLIILPERGGRPREPGHFCCACLRCFRGLAFGPSGGAIAAFPRLKRLHKFNRSSIYRMGKKQSLGGYKTRAERRARAGDSPARTPRPGAMAGPPPAAESSHRTLLAPSPPLEMRHPQHSSLSEPGPSPDPILTPRISSMRDRLGMIFRPIRSRLRPGLDLGSPAPLIDL